MASRQQNRDRIELPTTAFRQPLQQPHRKKLMIQYKNDALVPTIEQLAHVLRATGHHCRVQITHEASQKRRDGPLLQRVTAERSLMTGGYSRRTTSCRRNDQPTIQLESTDKCQKLNQPKNLYGQAIEYSQFDFEPNVVTLLKEI